MAYSKKVMDHYNNPQNVGKFDPNEENIGTGMVGAPACGDVMRLQIKVNPETGIIEDAKFKTYGCFVSNTYINTPTKEIKISDLNIGDEVLAWNGINIVNNKIKNIIKRQVPIEDLFVITFQREPHRKNIKPNTFNLICTNEHVFWNANNKPILAKDLKINQELYQITKQEPYVITHNGMKIVDIQPINHPNSLRGSEKDENGIWVYDLVLEDGAHVYFSKRVGSHNCGSAIASSSLLTQYVKGLSLNEAKEITNTQIAEELALPPVKIHCSILAEDSIKAAIDDYRKKFGIINN